MAIIEAGVVFSGIPIVKVRYYKESSKHDKLLTPGLLEAIQTFAFEIFEDETESFKMTRFTIYLHKAILKNSQAVTIYAICDSNNHSTTIREKIRDIARKFVKQFPDVNVGFLDAYRNFEQVITSTFGDLIFHPEDRLRSIFSTE
ncbi:MAG: hypothetical protein ACTSXO_04175 [Candidatus Heimdallarchaeota archaeon]|nr:MAG: hypothetical protein DRO91_06245 [Candidatus Heimdallarchaeota archaeon]RLI72209.1 MAG: hypothetical protein DRP02_02560 [Candidatus Gerdarchaeota archaeon]